MVTRNEIGNYRLVKIGEGILAVMDMHQTQLTQKNMIRDGNVVVLKL